MRGSVLKGRFEVVDLVAETATGLLFSGRVVPGQEPAGVAPGSPLMIKVVAGRSVRRRAAFELYVRDLEATARLGFCHHFIRHLDVDVVGGRLVVVTLFWPSVSLSDLLSRSLRLGWEAVLRCVRDLTGALERARTEGVEGRHVRPDDLLIDPQTGEAKVLRLSTPLGRRLAPAAQLPRPGEAADLALAGTLFYRLVVLAHPFDGPGETVEAAAERLAGAIAVTHPQVGQAEVQTAVALYSALEGMPQPRGAPPLTTSDVLARLDAMELANEEIVRRRERLRAWNRRRTGSSYLHTAFETVAAMRGEVRPPVEEPAVGGGPATLVPAPLSAAEQAVLVWSRIDTGPTPVLSDNPYVLHVLTALVAAAFLGTLIWLMFR